MITGSIVALVTPMHEDGSVDWDSLDRLLDLHLAVGTAAIGAVGTTGVLAGEVRLGAAVEVPTATANVYLAFNAPVPLFRQQA